MARGRHRYPSHRRLLPLQRRRWLLSVEALYGRALLEWPLVLASAATFGTAAFVLAIRGFDGCTAGSTVAALLPAWRLMAIAIFFVSPIMLLKLSAEMSGLAWREA